LNDAFNTTSGKRSAINLGLYLDKPRITINEGTVGKICPKTRTK
jgi:hypothetical protein